MNLIIFLAATCYAFMLIGLGGYCSYRRFLEISGSRLSERRDGDLFDFRIYFDTELVSKMLKIALVECLTLLGVFIYLMATPEAEIFALGIKQIFMVPLLSFGVAVLSIWTVIFLSQFLVDVCCVLFLTIIAVVIIIDWRKMRVWKK